MSIVSGGLKDKSEIGIFFLRPSSGSYRGAKGRFVTALNARLYTVKPLRAGLCPHMGADRRPAVVVAVRDWLPAEGGGRARPCASTPSAKTLFFFFFYLQTPAYLQTEPRSVRISRHVVDVGGRSEAAEEPPGCE